MSSGIIDKIVKEKIPCFFISPHLDDAMLSAGGLIYFLKDKTKIGVITIFTEAGPPPYTRFCNKFKQISGYGEKDANEFFSDRKKEDAEIFKKLNILYRHLDFVDVAWRKKTNPNQIEKLLGKLLPEFLHLYPLEWNFRSGRIVKEDKELLQNLEMKLKKFWINQKDYYFAFCPLAIGNHVDHVIVRDICFKTFPSDKIIFWADYPYIQWGNTANNFIKEKKLVSFEWSQCLEKKKNQILGYKTQKTFLFPTGEPKILPEIYYLKNAI